LNTIEYWIHSVLYEVFNILCAVPIIVVLIAVLKFVEHSGPGALLDVARILFGLAVIAYFFLSLYVARKATGHRTNDGAGLVAAFLDSWAETRVELAVLPVVGRWMSPKP
jgi:hypothetical protein